jgi:hypothetical protein
MMPLFELRNRSPRLAGLKFCLVSFLVVPLAPALSWGLGRGAAYDVYEVTKEGACRSGCKKTPTFFLRYVLKNGALFEFQEWWNPKGQKSKDLIERKGCSIVDEHNWTCPLQSTMIDGRLKLYEGDASPSHCPLLIKKR